MTCAPLPTLRSRWRRWLVGAVLVVAPLPAARAQANETSARYELLRGADVRLATIGYRLSVAGAPLCDRLEPGTGLQLHTLSQYPPASREQVRAHFRFAGDAAVEGVVPNSPAAMADVRADDSVLSINGVAIAPTPPGAASTGLLIALQRQLAALPPAAPIALMLGRNGNPVAASVRPVPACFTRYELTIGNSFDARANGELVQIGSRYFDEIDAALLPVAVAHELAHNILRHRERLKAVGADFGFASGFGRNVGYFRQTELQADILAVHLLARAGYDPHIAARFWREAGPRIMAGMIRSRSHPPLSDRVAIAEAEAAKFALGPLPPPPAFHAARGQPLTGEWRDLLPPKSLRP